MPWLEAFCMIGIGSAVIPLPLSGGMLRGFGRHNEEGLMGVSGRISRR